jgi:hypothetical protein
MPGDERYSQVYIFTGIIIYKGKDNDMFKNASTGGQHRYLKKLLAILIAVILLGVITMPYQIGYADEEPETTENYF